MLLLFCIYLIIGVFAAFLSGLLGIGGGLITIPALVSIFSYFHVVSSENLMFVVIGTALAGSIVNLISAVHAHKKQDNIQWSTFRTMSPGVCIGGLLVAPLIMSVISGNHLEIIFGFACLFFATQMIFSKKATPTDREKLPGKYGMTLLGLVAGTLSILLGLAGAITIGTILSYYRMDMRKVIGTTAAIALVLAISGSFSLMIMGFDRPNLPEWSTGFIYWPALVGIIIPSLWLTPLGARAAQKVPVQSLKKLFALLIYIIGIRMLFF